MALPEVEAFVIRARIKRDRSRKALDLSNLPKDINMLGEIKKKITQNNNKVINIQPLLTSIKCRSIHSSSDRIISEVKIIEYGKSSRVVDSRSGVLKYQKAKTDGDEIPHCFGILCPPKSKQAVIVIQRRNGRSLKTILQNSFIGYVESLCDNVVVEVRPAIPKEAIMHYMKNSTLKEVHYIGHGAPSDSADYVLGQPRVREGSIEVHIKYPDGHPGFFKKLYNRAIGKDTSKDLYSFSGEHFEDIKIVVEEDGKRKRIRMSKLENFRGLYDLSGDVSNDSEGHPLITDMSSEINTLLDSLGKRIGIIK